MYNILQNELTFAHVSGNLKNSFPDRRSVTPKAIKQGLVYPHRRLIVKLSFESREIDNFQIPREPNHGNHILTTNAWSKINRRTMAHIAFYKVVQI